MATQDVSRLSDVVPSAPTKALLQELVPPREFAGASFENYVPNTNYPSQQEAVDKCLAFVSVKSSKRAPVGVYLDGGFGVGKTHLLAAAFHAFKGKKLFGSFLAYTSLIGALGFANALKEFSGYNLIAIDEFELDDPGNTMIMSRLLGELSAKGVRFMATSNTPPNALGEGRFAAADFQREIIGIGSAFDVVRVDGEDYRHRPFDKSHKSFSLVEIESWLDEHSSCDDFATLLQHLAKVHPSLYGKMLQGVSKIALIEAHVLQDQNDALRFVSLVDRAYELQIPVRSTGLPLTEIFPSQFLDGGYRKKYLRAISRLGALVDL